MYVGKNNYQNDELTFKFANGGDWWFHAKQMPGSHVIVRKEQAETLPDATFEEAGRLAAYYSQGRQAPKVEIDYIQRRELKKPPKAKPVQKAVICRAKKSVANFKLRAGTPIGCKVTLRGERMYEFVDRFFNVALPRVRDFRGINPMY